jgi:predicted kinase
MLIIFGGLSGAGKTTIARALSSRLGATYLRIDTIEQALRGSGELKAEVWAAGYLIAYALAEDNLRTGGTVIADSVNPLQMTRVAWLAVAERVKVPAVEVEVVCSNAERHRQRVETRTSDIAGLRPPTWAEVAERQWDPWERSHIIIDTASKTVDEAVAGLLDDVRVRAGIGCSCRSP